MTLNTISTGGWLLGMGMLSHLGARWLLWCKVGMLGLECLINRAPRIRRCLGYFCVQGPQVLDNSVPFWTILCSLSNICFFGWPCGMCNLLPGWFFHQGYIPLSHLAETDVSKPEASWTVEFLVWKEGKSTVGGPRLQELFRGSDMSISMMENQIGSYHSPIPILQEAQTVRRWGRRWPILSPRLEVFTVSNLGHGR